METTAAASSCRRRRRTWTAGWQKIGTRCCGLWARGWPRSATRQGQRTYGGRRPGGNRAEDIPTDREAWFRLMWLSDRDFCQLMERCVRADVPYGFHVINGMSANTGMRWDVEHTRQLVGYQPQDDVTRG